MSVHMQKTSLYSLSESVLVIMALAAKDGNPTAPGSEGWGWELRLGAMMGAMGEGKIHAAPSGKVQEQY